ncbi:hypothetical protein [Flagellimonas allohymeniacidonis]|uniref:Uncharacterized protein n=1 Tax=Flagellimonas allohymeniacidonis TaxID=2517819 RepID=A0A4V2HSK0_9FLAO|nr:hypothetical protein [Allomuricauda hymeniacidonis]TAI48030.1 hypothetical protein EW142_15380 [Allomuricauda hymeniacidonis]
MSNNLLQTLASFQEETSTAALQLTFGTHQIVNYHNGMLLNRMQRQNSRLVLHKTEPSHLAKMEVVDSLVFQFSFLFEAHALYKYQKGQNICLPRPLVDGRLQIWPQQLELSFRIGAPDPSLCVHILHTYTGDVLVKKKTRSVSF